MNNSFKHRIFFNKHFNRRFRNLDREHQERIYNVIIELGNDQVSGKMLRGEHRGKYSLRVGMYRVFYESPNYCTIIILTVEHREVAY